VVGYNKEARISARYANLILRLRNLPKSAKRGVRSTIAVTYR